MNYYINIELLPNAEFSDSVLMNMLFSRLHKLLVVYGEGRIGISFPKFNRTLGSIVRLHGDKERLQLLIENPWKIGFSDYITVSSISHVPEKVSYRYVKRVQTKSNPERLLRRSIRKGWLTEQEAEIKVKEMRSKTLTHPYLRLKSTSTNQTFLNFVEHGPILEAPVEGTFSSYGLSSKATIPWF